MFHTRKRTTQLVPSLGCMCHGIFWNSLSSPSARYVAYANIGWGAESDERQKEASWAKAIRRRRDASASDVEFVPFSLEAGGVWGHAARKFFRTCTAVAGGDRDIDLYHWSTPRFSSAAQTLILTAARAAACVRARSRRKGRCLS
eukprot:COSAG06_NODE_4660_length_4058_cov_8.157868_5_plen_145_part_00